MPDHQREDGRHVRVPLRLSTSARIHFAQVRARWLRERAIIQDNSSPRSSARADLIIHCFTQAQKANTPERASAFADLADELERAMREEQGIVRPARRETMMRFDDVEWASNALVAAVDDLRGALDEFDGSPEALDAIRDAGHAYHTCEEILRDTRSLYRARGTYRDR